MLNFEFVIPRRSINSASEPERKLQQKKNVSVPKVHLVSPKFETGASVSSGS